MQSPDRDSTADWLLPENRLPPTLDELQGRIDEALATALSAESAVMAVGDVALDAAGHARRAAEAALRSAQLAERASRAALENGRPAPGDPRSGEARMQSFRARADRVAARLRALERLPA
jgi:hypothetical protein